MRPVLRRAEPCLRPWPERSIWQAHAAAGVDAIFREMDGLGTASPLILRRTLMELAAVRRAAGGAHCVSLKDLLADAGLSRDAKEVSLVLRAVAQNNIVFVYHQDMYNTLLLSSTMPKDAIVECNPLLVKEWTSRAGGSPGAYTLEIVPRGVRDAMIEELEGRIGRLKEHLSGSRFDRSSGCYMSLVSRAG